jgi:ERCC4-related helicase
MTTPIASSGFLPGSTVRARGLTWEVVHSEPAGEQLRYRLRCSQGDLRGHEIDLLAPFEAIELVVTDLNPKRAGRLKEWLLFHQAFLLEQALGPSALLAVQPGRLTIAPYQLVPVMRALSMSRPRLLLADGVGLGKTIEAGLIAAEMIARRRAHRVLIVSPAGPLLQQWQDEMRLRFGLRFEAIRDWGSLQEKRRELVMGANPFDHVALGLLSIDFAKQEKVLQDLERTAWDLVIIDEAHHAVKLGTAGDGEDSRRRRLAEVLARQADGLLLLTATPHDGYDAHFASLLELLDPSLIDGRGELRGDNYQRHVVRRLKHHIRDPKTGAEMFRKRIVTPCPVPFSEEKHPSFSALQRGLLALVAPRLRVALRKRRYGDVLAFVSLLKRSVSTVRACRSTLDVIASRYDELTSGARENEETRKQRLRTLSEYRRRIERYGTIPPDEEADQAALEAEDMAAHLHAQGADDLEAAIQKLLKDLRRVQRRERTHRKGNDAISRSLEGLLEICDAAEAEDPKLVRLAEEIQKIRQVEPKANVLVYTEYVDSQAALVEYLRAAITDHRIHGEILTIQGEDSEKDRMKVTGRFQSEDSLILVSTDATAEGLNLQTRCHHLLHLELPYNPNRLEQRNGRIDRYGQTQDPAVGYLYLEGTFEERVLLRLIAKYERQRARLTFVPDTLGLVLREEDRATEQLLTGLAEEQLSLFQAEPGSEKLFEQKQEDVRQPAYRDLLAEIESAVGRFEQSTMAHAWMGEAGLNAEPAHMVDAEKALHQGEALGGADLLAFVADAVESETRSLDAVAKDGSIWTLTLPPGWSHGLDDLPGWDATTSTLRLTTDPDLLLDAHKRSIGFLGRAHPVVRRALDRVRNIPLGDGKATLDRRVTAVSGDGPALVYTFLCTVQSEAGREFERLMAVRVRPSGQTELLPEPRQWLDLATPGRQVPTAQQWDRHFATWAAGQADPAHKIVKTSFAAVASDFTAQHTSEIHAERREVERWVAARAEELCGEAEQQLEIGSKSDGPSWRIATNPVERLAKFSNDRDVHPARRQEAVGVLKLMQTRLAQLDRRASCKPLEPVLLGLLMVVPS